MLKIIILSIVHLLNLDFYRDNKPTILWAGLETDISLFGLIDVINVRLQKFSIVVDKNKFKPHVTLLRIKMISE